MTPFASDPEVRARILRVAQEWVGTPYAADGCVKGSGVSCALLPYAVLTEAGFEVAPPPARGRLLKRELLPFMESWLGEREGRLFVRVTEAEADLGDVMLFDAGIGHLGLCLGNGEVLHSWQNKGAHVALYKMPSLLRRIAGVWRPISP